jgi:2-isopropylmalate synthase
MNMPAGWMTWGSLLSKGLASSKPEGLEFFQRAAKTTWKNAKIAAFGSTCAANKQPDEDANIRAPSGSRNTLLHRGRKTSVLQVTDVLRTSLIQLRIIEQRIAILLLRDGGSSMTPSIF